MSDPSIRVIIFLSLVLHGLGHGGALITLFLQKREINTGSWKPAKSWLFPSISSSSATFIAAIIWILSMLGFILTALSFWGIFLDSSWRLLAIIFATISLFGIIIFLGYWPIFNTLAALGYNILVLILLLLLNWPPQNMFNN